MLHSYELHFENQHIRSQNEPEVLPLFQIITNQLQLPFVTLFRRSQDKVQFWSTYPLDWMQHYLKLAYYENDLPLERAHLNRGMPNCWGSKSCRAALPQQLRIFHEARDFKINSGITIPIASDDPQELTAITFATDEEESAVEQTLKSYGIEALATSYMLASMIPSDPGSLSELHSFNEKMTAFKALSEMQRQRKHCIQSAVQSISYATEEMATHIPTDYVNEFKFHASEVLQHLVDQL
ncbi:MAG: autoinducer binding domain-containing protein [Holosporales bacterium]